MLSWVWKASCVKMYEWFLLNIMSFVYIFISLFILIQKFRERSSSLSKCFSNQGWGILKGGSRGWRVCIFVKRFIMAYCNTRALRNAVIPKNEECFTTYNKCKARQKSQGLFNGLTLSNGWWCLFPVRWWFTKLNANNLTTITDNLVT